MEETGVKPFSKYSSVDTAGLKRAILSQDDKYDFVTVGKRGNTLLINVFERAPDAERAKEKSSITARESGVITYISVLRGTALKKVGDTVNAGETVIEGGAIDGETVFRDRAEGRFTIRCERSFEFPALDTDEKKANAEIARLKAFLDKEDALAEYSYKTSSGGFILVVKLIYSVTEGGEINEQNNG